MSLAVVASGCPGNPSQGDGLPLEDYFEPADTMLIGIYLDAASATDGGPLAALVRVERAIGAQSDDPSFQAGAEVWIREPEDPRLDPRPWFAAYRTPDGARKVGDDSEFRAAILVRLGARSSAVVTGAGIDAEGRFFIAGVRTRFFQQRRFQILDQDEVARVYAKLNGAPDP